VVLPDTPSPEEVEMYLTMMGHFGAQTGYPVLNVTVTNADGMNGTKDYLVMGTVDDSPAINKLNSSLPVSIKQDGLRIQDTNGFFDRFQNAWWKVRSSEHVESGKLETAGGLPDAMIEGMEYSGHSVVLIALKDKTVVPNFLNVFLARSQTSDISQSVSVLNGTRFVSYRIGNAVYHVGSLNWLLRLKLLFSAYPWLIVLIVLVICFLIAALLRAMLRRHARRRLQANE
jgi:cellulose synthase (UDP-forming)